jgi:hypothetical protein
MESPVTLIGEQPSLCEVAAYQETSLTARGSAVNSNVSHVRDFKETVPRNS